jgi:DNA-binding NtrC family response regulator
MILVQHNEKTIRLIAIDTLTHAGYQCRGVASPRGAWRTLNSKAKVDLVLCKVFESLDNGLIERASKKFPDLSIVTWGARPVEMFMESVRKGACDYLRLPFEREELLEVVRRGLDHHCLKLTMTPQKRSEMCYDIREYTRAARGFMELGDKEKACEFLERIDEMTLKLLVDARQEAKGTPDYKPRPF